LSLCEPIRANALPSNNSASTPPIQANRPASGPARSPATHHVGPVAVHPVVLLWDGHRLREGKVGSRGHVCELREVQAHGTEAHVEQVPQQHVADGGVDALNHVEGDLRAG